MIEIISDIRETVENDEVESANDVRAMINIPLWYILLNHL